VVISNPDSSRANRLPLMSDESLPEELVSFALPQFKFFLTFGTPAGDRTSLMLKFPPYFFSSVSRKISFLSNVFSTLFMVEFAPLRPSLPLTLHISGFFVFIVRGRAGATSLLIPRNILLLILLFSTPFCLALYFTRSKFARILRVLFQLPLLF